MRLISRLRLDIDCAQACPVVAMLRPRSGSSQWLVSDRYSLTPEIPVTEYTDGFGNLCQRFVVPPGGVRIEVTSEADVAPNIDVNALAPHTPVQMLPSEVLVYLLQSRYCPSDKMYPKALEIVGSDTPSGYAQVERIRAWIHEHFEYRYGVSSESTDALDTIEAAAGVCRDFAHVGVALCRSLRIPARIVVGYLYGLEPMDLHAWFEAYLDGRWYTFDATQAEARGGRMVVAYGRDIADVAFLSNYGALNIASMKVEVERNPSHQGASDASLPSLLLPTGP